LMPMPVESAHKPASPPPEKMTGFAWKCHTSRRGQFAPGRFDECGQFQCQTPLANWWIGGLCTPDRGRFFVASEKRPSWCGRIPIAGSSGCIICASTRSAGIGAPDTDGPTVAATAEELARPWSAKQFTFVKPLTHEKVDAMVIRLPGGRLWAFALLEAYGHCDLKFVTDLGELAKQYGYRASHPMVASPCSSTVYDPLKVSALSGDVFVRANRAGRSFAASHFDRRDRKRPHHPR